MIPSADDITKGSERSHIAFRGKYQCLGVVTAELSRGTPPTLCTNYPERVQMSPFPRGVPCASTPPPSQLHLSQWPQLSAKLMLLPEISGYQTLSESPRGLLQPAYWSPLPVSDLVGLGWGTRICISNKFPGMMVLLVQVHTLRSPF